VECIAEKGLDAPQIGALNIFIKFIVEYIGEKGLHALGLGWGREKKKYI
jgi:hypothetical protein